MPEGKIINAYDVELIFLVSNTPTNHRQQRVVAHWHHQTIGKSCSRSAAERQTKVMDDRLKPLSATAVAGEHVVAELFAEDAPTAKNGIAPKPTRYDCQLYPPAAER